MTKQKTTKRALLMSALSLLVCVTMLIGSTFAWFTDSVTSSGNKIQSGTLKLDLELLDKDTEEWNSIKETKAPIFNYDKWEPGYTDVKILKIENEGTLALKWYAKFISADDLSILADVIDVYVKEGVEEYPENRTDLSGWTKVGTVREFVNTIETTTTGNLAAGAFDYLGIALKMQEEANNNYQGLTLGAFDIMILAAQDTVEGDSFDDQYDTDAEYDKVKLPAKKIKVTTADEFKAALNEAATGERELIIDATGVEFAFNEIADATSGRPVSTLCEGITIKGATISASTSNDAFLTDGAISQNGTIVFEDCDFTTSDFTGKIYFQSGQNAGNTKLVFNNCDFYGQLIVADNTGAGVEFNSCTFNLNSGNTGYVQCMGGTVDFNSCTFNISASGNRFNNASTKFGHLNLYSDRYNTNVTLNGCNSVAVHKYDVLGGVGTVVTK